MSMPNKSQSVYKIKASARCRTHPAGAVIYYTGPRANVPNGLTVVERVEGE